MEDNRRNVVWAKEHETGGERKKSIWQSGNLEEKNYRVVADENSIYEYDMDCMRGKKKIKK